MSEFYVNESSIDTAAQRMTALAGEVPRASDYASAHLGIGLRDTGLLLSTIMLTTNPARDAVVETLASIREHLTAAATELDATAATYRATDDAVDARLDATY